MKAMVQDRFGPPDVLRLADTGLPEVGVGDVLVRVHAAALNPADWHILRGDPLVARLMGDGDLAGRGINRAVVAAVVDLTRLHRRLSFAPHGRASRFVACKRNAPMTARVTTAPSASLVIWGGRLRDPTRSLTANGSLLAWRICQHRMRAILLLGPILWKFPK